MKFASVFTDNQQVVHTPYTETDFSSFLDHAVGFVDNIGMLTPHFFALSIARS